MAESNKDVNKPSARATTGRSATSPSRNGEPSRGTFFTRPCPKKFVQELAHRLPVALLYFGLVEALPNHHS
jgi:hypothetical protein